MIHEASANIFDLEITLHPEFSSLKIKKFGIILLSQQNKPSILLYVNIFQLF